MTTVVQSTSEQLERAVPDSEHDENIPHNSIEKLSGVKTGDKELKDNNTDEFNKGQPTLDKGQPALDKGQPTLDKGQPTLDKGQPALDKGQPALDKGQPTLDKGQPAPEQTTPAQPTPAQPTPAQPTPAQPTPDKHEPATTNKTRGKSSSAPTTPNLSSRMNNNNGSETPHLPGNVQDPEAAYASYSIMVNKLQQYVNDSRNGLRVGGKKRVHWRDEPLPFTQRMYESILDFGANVLDQVADSWPLTLAAAATVIPIGLIAVSATWIFVLLAAVGLLAVFMFVAGGCLIASSIFFPVLLCVMLCVSFCGAVFFAVSLTMNLSMAYWNQSGDVHDPTDSPYPPVTPLATPNIKQNRR